MKKVEAQKQAAREACERLALDGWHPPSAKSFERLMEEKKSGMNKNLKDRKPRKRRRRKLPS